MPMGLTVKKMLSIADICIDVIGKSLEFYDYVCV